MKRILLMVVLTCASGSMLLHAQSLKVLTYNIHHGENMKGQLDLQGIANVILATNPDLVALQEVDSATKRTDQQDQLKELASLTGMYTYFGKAMDYDGGGYGVGILSRLPIVAQSTIALPVSKGIEPRAMAVVTVKMPGDSLLQFAAAHLDAENNPADRINQANTLIQYFSRTKLPTILAGDFNAIPAAKEIAILKELFTDATHQLGPTWPADVPTVKLDYILLAPKHQWTITSTRIIKETVASDHRPVLCELELKLAQN
jgi:endonuclease/exonuclease/phosphatase family metal-dependent hydrolase